MLTVAKGDPISCAIGLGSDPGIGLIMLHKTKGPKAVEKDLTAKFSDTKLTRWGTVQVDDEGLVKFIVNKATSGMARRLTKSLKGTGFKKVAILLEDGTLVEGAVDEEEDGEGESQEQEAVAPPVQGSAPPEAPVQSSAPQPDMAELEKELRSLIGQIGAAGGGDAGKMSAMKAAAGEAAGALKAKDAEKVVDALAKLKEAIAAPGGTPVPAAAPAAAAAPPADAAQKPISFVTMQKSRLLWDSARKRVAGEIAGLKKEALAFFDGDPEESQVMDALDQLDEITGALDERLIDALDDLLNEQDPVKHAVLLKDAKEVLDDYAEFVASNELVQKLSGDTPFGIKLSIGPTYTSVIKALQGNLH